MQTQTYKRIKRMNNDEDNRRKLMEMPMTDEMIKNAKAVLKKMTENKKSMKKKVDKVKEISWKTTASKSKSKNQNNGKSRSKRE